ncbi:MAG: phage minor capsid protein [Lachnospira pectinoschiza]
MELNTEYDIEKAFRAIEDELIASMIRNLDGHRAEEDELGFNWTQWQVEQLKALEKYKADNKTRFAGKFSDINSSIDAMIFTARQTGGTEQEQKILRALKNGLKASKVSQGTEGAFFKLNTRKLNALIKATKSDFNRAEKAMLRMSEDKYRQIIFNAQVYANTGAGTYEKAVDMATKDFLKAGINCIEYANGSRHTVKDYAKMAIQTANKRAYLTGEGEMRQSWGISTVIMNKRANACPKCLPFVGKVLIDDVWSGGKASDGPYPLMSSAMAAGLYHPNCKDIHTTYFPELDEEPDSKFTKKELEKVKEDYRQDQKQQYAGRMVEQFDRLAKYSLDKDNCKMYAARKEQWENEVLKQKNRGKKVIITEQAIDKVNEINPKGFTSDNNKFIKEVHKDLLKVARDENNSNEVACVVDLITNKKTKFIKGGRHEVDVYSDSDMFHLLHTAKDKSLVLCHNHPGLTDFSANDIGVFMRHDTIKTMTIVTNQGDVRYISKGEHFDYNGAVELMRECQEKYSDNINKCIDLFLKKCYSVGIQRG